MTPDSKKKTATKIPAKKKVATKTAVSTKEIPVKKAANKTAVNTRETKAKKATMKPAVSAKEAPAKKVTRETPAKPRQTTAKKVAKKSTTISKPQTSSISISSEERWKMIAIAAYHRAEKRGFSPGGEMQDWAEAEKEVDELLMSG
jgi:hypothetical protein